MYNTHFFTMNIFFPTCVGIINNNVESLYTTIAISQ
jgi:hypothetical protein